MRSLLTFSSLFYFLIIGHVFASEDTPGKKLLTIMEFNVSMESLSIQIQDIGTDTEGLIPEVRRDWAEVAAEVFQSKKIFNISSAYFDEHLTAEQIEEAIEFLNTDLGVKMTQMEKNAQDHKNIGQSEIIGPKLLSEYAIENPKRLEQIEVLINELGGVEEGVAMAMNFAFAMNSAFISSSDNPSAVSDEQLLDFIAGQYDAIFKDMEMRYVNTIAYTYQEATNDEINAYLVFLKSDLGKDIYSTLNLVVVDTLTASFREFGSELMKRAQIRDL